MCKQYVLLVCLLLTCFVESYYDQLYDDNPTIFVLNAAYMRFAHFRCKEKFPQGDVMYFTDSSVTHGFWHCVLYKSGLMNLKTRSLDGKKFFDIWQGIAEPREDCSCWERFDFRECLSGLYSDTYRKLMEFREICTELFEYTFGINNTLQANNFEISKKVGESATEFCDFIEGQNVAEENSQENDVSLLSLHKEKLECIFENIHYLDAYGRVDESEINASYQEADENSKESEAVVHICSHRANAKYQFYYVGNSVRELEKCLRAYSPVFDKVLKMRDETSKQY